MNAEKFRSNLASYASIRYLRYSQLPSRNQGKEHFVIRTCSGDVLLLRGQYCVYAFASLKRGRDLETAAGKYMDKRGRQRTVRLHPGVQRIHTLAESDSSVPIDNHPTTIKVEVASGVPYSEFSQEPTCLRDRRESAAGTFPIHIKIKNV